MAVNPDPKPGRWILPLVILGMIAFTFFFVRALPEASPDTTLVAGPPQTTSTTDATTETTQPSDNTSEVDPNTQSYLDELDAINAEVQVLETELLAINEGFDAEPREVDYGDAESRMETVLSNARALVERLGALTVPAGLEINNEALTSALAGVATAAQDALSGLQSSDTGEQRRAALEAFTVSASDFDTEVQNAKNAAGVA